MGLATRLSRGWRSRIKYLLVALVGGCLIVVVILSLGIVGGGIQPKRDASYENYQSSSTGDVLAVIVPFRDRFEELLSFAPHIHRFLSAQRVAHTIWLVNQVDEFRFNRASLINIGFIEATKNNPTVNYMAMHDVDLLPLNDKLPYGHPGVGNAVHVASLHPKYNYASFIGGILILDVTDFQRVDGMSNIYWGWGLEDDEFWLRLKHNGIKVKRANKGLGTGRKDTFSHIHSPKLRVRDRAKCFDQWEKTRKRDRATGLRNVNYTLLSQVEMSVEDAHLTVLNVRLHCDRELTPWCQCPDPVNNNNTLSNNNNQPPRQH
ncbi:xylosylprotein 4-beta-galactosyltransferase [Folsomia candida]|uniref:xylosylprotein 4-beta-galactosyltransferase n=1 Tax=Folsomia candida TaxID=158441 RepID=UPI000B9023FB|nr:xylosylprotein 4-beta-galactosyltransferase [Folsomia candida]